MRFAECSTYRQHMQGASHAGGTGRGHRQGAQAVIGVAFAGVGGWLPPPLRAAMRPEIVSRSPSKNTKQSSAGAPAVGVAGWVPGESCVDESCLG